MKRLLLFLAAVLCIAAPLRAVPVTPHDPVIITKVAAANTYNLAWPGLPGYTYFIQTTLNAATGPWIYCPFVENGTGTTINWACTVPPGNPRWFLRLKYTDAPNAGDGRYADFDGDGIPNIVEVTGTGTGIGTGTATDPFALNNLPDADNDGIIDAAEVFYFGTTAAQNGTGDADGDGISNLDEIKFFGTNPTFNDDTDNDGYIKFDEMTAGSSPTDPASKPFDPFLPPPANRFVVPLAWWIENKFGDTLEALQVRNLQIDINNYQARATAIADGSYDLPYISIQAAINAAAAGEVIQVAPGTYPEAINLTNRNLRLIGQRGSREETIIEAPAGSAQGLLLGAGNPATTTVSGLTVRNAGGVAIRCQSQTGAVLHNLLVQGSQSGIVVDGASPVLLNLVVDACTGVAATDAGLRVFNNSQVRAGHCTFTENVPGNAVSGQVQLDGATASLTMTNSIVSSVADRPGGQISAINGAVAAVSYSSIRGGFDGTTNLSVANANGVAPLFDNQPVTGGQRRLLRTNPCVDRASPAGIAGYFYWTRFDADGEARQRGYRMQMRVSSADIGADEYVSRLAFPRKGRIVRNVLTTFSEVDEASDVAFLGLLANGNAMIAVINDEVIEWDMNANGIFDSATEPRKNVVTFYEINWGDGLLLNPTEYSLRRTVGETAANKDQEVRDPEAMAYDPVNLVLHVVTSQTKVNRYRDCEGTVWDPLTDPPSNDYDPRRNCVVSIQLNAVFLPISKMYVDSNDGAWAAAPANRRDMNAFTDGTSATSPVGFNSPNGLIATVQAQLQGNAALGALVKNAGVLVAINTVPKFGEPATGVTYQSGQGLPYNNANGLGGASASAGFVLANPANAATADFPYWTLPNLPPAGLQVVNYRTAPGGALLNIQANTTYYFKVWAYDAQRNYGRGLEAEATTSNTAPVRINEFNANGPAAVDWIELFNPSGIPVTVGLFPIMDEADRTTVIPAATVIQPRSFLNYAPTWTLGAPTDNVRLFLPGAVTAVDHYEQYTRNQLVMPIVPPAVVGVSNTEGRAWDGGPRGKSFNYERLVAGVPAPRFESQGGLYRTLAGSPEPTTQTLPNHTQAQGAVKFLQATHNHVSQTGVFLHYANPGEEPPVWSYSPKQQDFHPISVEGLAYRNAGEMVVGLRSPLTNRRTGDAYALVFSNAAGQFLPAGGWAAPAGGFQQIRQLNLNGQGIRSIQWCPQLNGGTGAYLIIGGSANGGPLKNETSRQVFSLYRWDALALAPVRVVADLSPFAVRPEGANIISLNGAFRVVFVEDRFKAIGYDTQNAVHWPLSALNLQ